MQVSATAKYIHMAPRKTRLVVDLVRGLPIAEARQQLMFSKKNAAKPVLKVLNSAIANAENNFKLDTSKFFVTLAFVDEGPTIHRYRPRAHGRATPIRKRMSHITVAVGPKAEIGIIPDKAAVKKELEAAKKEKTVKAAKKVKAGKKSDKKAVKKEKQAKKPATNKETKSKEAKK